MTRRIRTPICLLALFILAGCGSAARSPMSDRSSSDRESDEPQACSAMPDEETGSSPTTMGDGETSRSIAPEMGVKAQGADHSEPRSAAPPEDYSGYDTRAMPYTAPPPEDHVVVKVFYGTDRRPMSQPLVTGRTYVERFLPLALAAALTALALFLSPRLLKQRLSPHWTLLGVASSVLLGLSGAWSCWKLHLDYIQPRNDYGNGRGDLTVGVCDVTIPLAHDPGELETPSLLRLEFRPDPSKHIVLHSVTPLDMDEFYAQMQFQVNTSSGHDVLVFVHGFDNTYENAVRRTAQIAYDLKFTGAAVCYSWPSQGGLFKYFVDEANVESTIPHLQAFLRDIAARSDAQRIHLIAHSMGNRALTGALRALAQEIKRPAFNEVILTAPDVDATVFKRDIVPAIGVIAQRTTLYASSNDRALFISRKIHGQPRAGDSGQALIVLPGLDTVDVSAVDTSLLGHSYYGSNESVLADIYELIHAGQAPANRRWLRQVQAETLPYWIFGEATAIARPDQPMTR
ncbi:MAG: alpha/beta hydrolase [Pirellulales bacterium]